MDRPRRRRIGRARTLRHRPDLRRAHPGQRRPGRSGRLARRDPPALRTGGAAPRPLPVPGPARGELRPAGAHRRGPGGPRPRAVAPPVGPAVPSADDARRPQAPRRAHPRERRVPRGGAPDGLRRHEPLRRRPRRSPGRATGPGVPCGHAARRRRLAHRHESLRLEHHAGGERPRRRVGRDARLASRATATDRPPFHRRRPRRLGLVAPHRQRAGRRRHRRRPARAESLFRGCQEPPRPGRGGS